MRYYENLKSWSEQESGRLRNTQPVARQEDYDNAYIKQEGTV